jgi:predicted phosphoribosyltransferase
MGGKDGEPSTIIMAIPAPSRESLAALQSEADAVVCLLDPADFSGVGQFYRDFPQVDDGTVTSLLCNSPRTGGAADVATDRCI